MTKPEFIEAVSQNSDYTKKAISEIFDVTVGTIIQCLAEGKTIKIAGFGEFGIRTRAAHTGRNPRTGEAVEVDEKNTPYFKAGKSLRKAVCLSD